MSSMSTQPHTVEVRTTGTLKTGNSTDTHFIRLLFRENDPAAVRIIIGGLGYAKTWEVDRTLIERAYEDEGQRYGQGDVRVVRRNDPAVPALTKVMVTLHGIDDDGQPCTSKLTISGQVVGNFIGLMNALVPLGSETYDVDAWLVCIFATEEDS